MTLRFSSTVLQGVVQARVELDSPPANNPPAISPREAHMLATYGELLVDVGGVVDPSVGANVTLPARQVYLPSNFPVVQRFAFADYPTNAVELALAWRDLVKTNVDTALETLLAKPEPPNTVSVVNLPT